MHVLIVGRSFEKFNLYLQAHGMTYTILRDQDTVGDNDAPDVNQVVVDFTDTQALKTAVTNLPARPDCAITVYENYVVSTAWINQWLGLPGMSIEAARACSDKALMRAKFAASIEPISPAFREISSWSQAEGFAREYGFPLMLKPANLVKSLLVLKANSLDELRDNWQHMQETISDVYHRWAPHQQPKIVIEQYLSGHVYSTDAFVDIHGQVHVLPHIVDYQTGYEVGYDDNFHYSRLLPSKLSLADQEKLLHCARLGCEALGMRASPAHIEIIMTSTGPRLVEIGARNGGYRPRMYDLSLGLDIYANAIATVSGGPLNLTPTKNEPVAVLELFPKRAGTFVELSHQAELEQLPSLEYLSLKRQPGEYAGKSRDGHKMSAIIILHHVDPEQFAHDLQFVNQQVRIVTA